MMYPSHCSYFSSIITIYFSLLIHALASPSLHVCRHDQRDALLEFIDEFPIDHESYPSPWNKSSNCCLWEGVTCNDKSGQVISLDLSYTSLNSSLKTNSSLFRLQYLRHLNLVNCNLQGEIPSSLGNLSRLLELELGYNQLEGEVPASIGNLKELRVMWLGNNSLSGNIPISFANLTKLSYFSVPSNNFTSTLPSDMSGFHNLEYFDVSENSFLGLFPKSLFSIPSLQWVSLARNQFTGPIEFANTSSSSSKLQYLYLSNNRFDGPIPESISKFLNLELLHLRYNYFSGPIPTSITKLVNLRELHLSHNYFSGPIPRSISKLVNLRQLHMDVNNLTGPIPGSISKLVNLDYLDLSHNMLEGDVPSFLWRLVTVWLSHNSFSSFEKSSQERQIHELDLSWNSFRGPFPLWICKLKGLSFLDLSNNLFNGSIPPCLSFHLTKLSLRNNNFSGTLSDIFVNATNLRAFDFSGNQLEGKFPMSLINCKALQLVNVESNKFKDEFPSWLGSLPSLHVLILRSNEFYGPLYHRYVSTAFQSLRVIDISHNDFSGTLPPYYFSNWREMTTLTEGNDQYMDDFANYSIVYQSMEMVNKGVDMRFARIRQDFRAIDFSGNRIYGKIPESIGFLKELILLNLSGNAFTSHIPQFLENLTKLESLDLSRNKLSGQIPQDLGKLSFLSYMNFSHNLLQGPVPRGTQFQRQNCSSFMGNSRLVGLEEICGETHVPNPTTSQQSKELFESEEQMVNWVVAAIAYGPGVLCGLMIGHIFTSHNHEWLTEKFGRRKLKSPQELVKPISCSLSNKHL